ncbi:Endonuclease_I [Hexamita inflata]|uniref:Endonuclease I n=1 Tax=Hexamita inflata TaxID=28002 RepID=A0AA86UW80_9EUKA|nr:Endonuclease I [Hexamita inflata]
MLLTSVLSAFYPGLYGKELRAQLLTLASQNQNVMSYDEVRLHMYSSIYNNASNLVTCVYSGSELYFKFGSDNPNVSEDLNCEHTVPQSFFNKELPMRSDLHHLRPTWKIANSGRSNSPFNSINEMSVDKYYGKNKTVTTKKPTDPENWSKLDGGNAFEVRDMQKGDTARAVAYFFVRYPTQAGPITMTFTDIDNMIKWDNEHPPTDLQMEYYEKVVEIQRNINPFQEETGLVARAYCDMSTKYPCSKFM